MSHVEQKESIKITVQKAGVLHKNVPVVDHYLNNYQSHKATETKLVATSKNPKATMNSNVTELTNVNSCQITDINHIYLENPSGRINLH